MTLEDVEKIPVGLVRCDEYDEDLIEQAVRDAINLAGGINRFLKPGMHVLVKPNLLMGADPSKAVCTHPAVLKAVCTVITGHGCTVTIADSPGAGIPYKPRNLIKAYDLAGYTELGTCPDVTLNKDTSSRTVSFPDGFFVRQFEIISPILDADAVVVVSKLKTHIYTGLTGATKNMFGAIPGLDKPPYHARMQDDLLFGKMLIDLNRCVKPILQVMDAIEIMEGDGPMAGTPAHLGAILASPDYIATDIVAARLIGFEPLSIGSIKAAKEKGLTDESRIDVKGATIQELTRPDIIKPQTQIPGGNSTWIRSLFRPVVYRLAGSYTLHPHLIRHKCTRCHKCERICPVSAVNLQDGYPIFDKNTCIRCYCCHEMCDSHAISLQPGLLYRILRPFIR
ncbi:DUF362 domain-containing protein [Methanospirillum lacunae]|uniref:Thylakoid associated protein n=1 Tax=Methanospirillum lacunae TaxID=668570 RepID=A0A2V2MYT7_9EURY|nr:DUF362 domain-containing protein [Methanospirillum lacunae]PWR71470.1 Thylakoid associated protein [Methanospirillum lacunae]